MHLSPCQVKPSQHRSSTGRFKAGRAHSWRNRWSRCRTSSSRESRRGVKQLFTSPSPRPRRLEGVTVGAKKTLSGGARRLSSAFLTRFLQRLQRARRVRENRGDRRQKEEKVGGGGGGVGERVVVDPRHRDRVRGRRRWEEVVVGVGV